MYLRKQIKSRAKLNLRPNQRRQVANAQDVLQTTLDTRVLALLLLVVLVTSLDRSFGLGLPSTDGIEQVTSNLGILVGIRTRSVCTHRLELLGKRLERSRQCRKRRDRGVGSGTLSFGRSRQEIDTGTLGQVVLERAWDGQEDAVFGLVGEADRGANRAERIRSADGL